MIWQGNNQVLNTSGAGKLIMGIQGNRNELTLPMIPVVLAIQSISINIQGNRNSITIPMVANGLDPYKIIEFQGFGNTVNGVELIEPLMEGLGAQTIYIGQPGQHIQIQGDYENGGYIGGQYVINEQNVAFSDGTQNMHVANVNYGHQIQMGNVYDAGAFNMVNVLDEDGTSQDEEQNVQAAPAEEVNVLREHKVTIQGNRNVINVWVAGDDDGNEIKQTSDIVQGNRNTIGIAMKF